MKNPFTPAVRRWIYGIAIAAIALAVQQGWVDAPTAALIAPLVLAILNVKPDGGDGGGYVPPEPVVLEPEPIDWDAEANGGE